MIHRQVQRAVIGLVALVVAQVGAPSASADTGADLERARQNVANAQAAANAAATELSTAEGRIKELTDEVDRLEAEVRRTQAQAAELQDVVRRRAVFAYTHGSSDNLGLVLSAGSTMTATRRLALMDRANATNNLSVRRLAALRSDLEEQQASLQARRVEQRRVTDQLAAQYASVQANLAAANRARDELVARLERERADAAAAAELARLRAAREASVSRPSGGSAGQLITNPGGGSFQCPVSGSAFGDSFGRRGSGFHYGIDMLAPSGVPEVAVKAGVVSYVPMGGAGGNEAYLAADDGNVYYYAHMSSFVGGPRRVAQGEIIGLVGSTGNSTTPHLHFEIRVGGANGQRVDPLPTLRAAGC